MSEDGTQTEQGQPLYATCPNCGARIEGPWCYQCGQNQKGIKRFFLSLLNEAFDDVFSLNSRTVKTFANLVFRPGFLTTEYYEGRRARYLPPVRLYLITSVIFFFYLSVENTVSDAAPMVLFGPPTEETRQELDKVSAKLEERIAATDKEGDATRQQIRKKIITDFDEAKAELDALGEEADGDFEIQVPWLSEEEEKLLAEKLKAQAKKASEDPGALIDALLDIAPPILFVILPLFAMLLKIFYLGSGKYYSEHLILAVHNHSFLFVALLTGQLLDAGEGTVAAPATGAIDTALNIWMPVYMYLSLLRTYGQGYVVTALKGLFLFIGYQLFFGVTLLGIILWGLMSL